MIHLLFYLQLKIILKTLKEEAVKNHKNKLKANLI